MEQFTNVLPADFNGTFYFTNPSNEDFVGKWGGKAYTYPAMKTTPMVILDATPLEVQNIRKKFAKELAEREFFKTARYESMRSSEGIKDANGVLHPNLMSFTAARAYTVGDLQDLIQKCLDPLPVAPAPTAMDLPKINIEDRLSRDEDGELNTQPVTRQTGLKLKEKNRA